MVTKKTTRKTYKQKPVPGTNRLIDLVIPALPPGWRISKKTGEPYFENRDNRSDTAAEIAAFVPKAKKPTATKKTKKATSTKPKRTATTKKTVKPKTPAKVKAKKAKPRRKGQISLF